MRCPCNSGDILAECCGRFLAPATAAVAPTAEALMRSRFTAFALRDEKYLLYTWHSSTRPMTLELDSAQKWLRLEILDKHDGGPWDSQGTVTFAAHYSFEGQRGKRQELSRFVREDKQWFYVDGDVK